jgi:hypothetical protein
MTTEQETYEQFERMAVELGLQRVMASHGNLNGDRADWPAPLGATAYHGLVGRFTRAVEPHTESDPAAILIQTLVLIGNAMGRGPHFHIEDSRHGTNLHIAVVGNTSLARKGTSLSRAWRFVSLADLRWGAKNDGDGGLSTAEGLIHAVRDPSGTGKNHDQGVSDKRFLAMMGEFGETLGKMKREGNTLGSTIRNAWDGKTLKVTTRSRPLVATNAHVSIIGHITSAELKAQLTATDVYNGFGNRFLWPVVKRSKLLADPSDFRVDTLTDLIEELALALDWTQHEREIPFDLAARAAWKKLYRELGNEDDDGRYDAMTSRAAPLIRRLALIYATLDRSEFVTREHLRAGLEVWRYCEQSAEYLFSASEPPTSGLETRVLNALRRRDGEWVPRSKLYRIVDGGMKVKSYALSAALEALVVRGAVEGHEVSTGGRPAWEYRAAPGDKAA